MTTEPRPIAFVLGVPGQVYTAKALGMEFQRPVVGLINYARMEEHLDESRRAVFARLYSLPLYYLENREAIRALPRADLDREQERLEKKFGITHGTMNAYYDRALRWSDDYMKIRHYQVAALRFTEDFLQKENPAFMMDGVATYLQNILRAAGRQRNIPYLMTLNGRVNGRFEVVQGDGQLVGMQKTFAMLQEGREDAVAPHIRQEADEAFTRFVDKPQRPLYAQRNANMKFSLRRLLPALRYAFDPARVSSSPLVRMVDQDLKYENTTPAIIRNGLRNKMRRVTTRMSGSFEKTPDLNVPYVYMPLHYTPEISDMYYGTAYDHHAGFVSQFAKHIPSGTQLYVKEHTSMIGRRPASFYRELAALYNVTLIDPSVDTFSLIKNSRAVATVTGTAGLEAFLLGKPAIVMGNMYFNFLPGVLHVPLDDGTAPAISRFLEEFRDDKNARMNAYRAYFACTYAGTKGDIGNDVGDRDIPENARAFAEGLRLCISRWHEEIPGTFPQEIRAGKTGKEGEKDRHVA